MALQFPIRVEKNSTYKMKITLKTPQGVLNLTDIGFEGELKNSVYDDTGLPLQFDIVDAYNGSLFVSIPNDVSKQMDYYDGVYVIRYVAQDGLKYRLIEGTTEIVWEGRGNSQPVNTSDVEHLTIILDGEPELETLATVGLPGPKLTYDDLTESDKENLREGVYEAVQEQVDVAVDAKEAAETAGDNAQNAANLIQNTYLPESRQLKTSTENLKNQTATLTSQAATDAQDANLAAQNAADIRTAVEGLKEDVETLEGSTRTLRDQTASLESSTQDAATAASNSATSANSSATEASSDKAQTKIYRDEAETFKNQAQQAAESAFESKGTFQPTASQEYPTVPTRDTRWTLKAYTFTSGGLAGKQAVDGDTLIYEVSDGGFALLRTGAVILGNPITEIVGANGITYEGPSVTLSADIAGARPNDWVPDWAIVTGKPDTATRWPTPSEAGALPNTYVPDWDEISNKPPTATRWPTAVEAGALPNSYLPDWSDLQNVPSEVANPISPIPQVTTSTTGDLTGSKLLTWLAPSTASTITRSLVEDVQVLVVKDAAGNASTGNVIVQAPTGYTIEGDSTITLDRNFGWFQIQLNGNDYKLVKGG